MDFAFLRFEDSISKALEMAEHANAKNLYYDQIRLATDEKYVQITNTLNGISFSGNWDCDIVDFCDKVLLNITAKVTITEFTDNKGKKQIVFEVENIGTEFYEEPVLIRIKHTVSNVNWYSNPINITNRNKERSTLFHYRDYGNFWGIAYNRANVMQIIRLSCYFTGSDVKSQSDSYINTAGNEISSRLIITDLRKYKFDNINEFTYLRFNRLLAHSVKYIDYIRATNSFTVESSNFMLQSNMMEIEFKASMNLNEDYRLLNSNANVKDYFYPDYDNVYYETN